MDLMNLPIILKFRIIMTLEEAIEHCEQKACEHSKCAEEHKQLAEWLKELQALRKNTISEETLKRYPSCKDCIKQAWYHCSKPDDEDCANYEDIEEYKQRIQKSLI